MPLQGGQGSGDFRETSSRVQVLYRGKNVTWGNLTADAFTQNNPPVVTATNNVSTTWSSITRKGVLGSSVAFCRPDIGNGYHGGPILVAAAYAAGQKPLGIFANDAVGNSFENTPGVASGKGPYHCGLPTLALSLWETQRQIGGSTTLVYAAGDKVYASVNGLLTNRIEDAYEYNVTSQNDPDFVTVMGIIRTAPDANNTLMVVDLRV